MPEVGQAWVTIGGRDAALKATYAQDLQHTRQFVGRATGMLRPLLGIAGFGGVAATLKSAVSHAAQFEKQMASVATMLDSRTMPMLKGMSAEVRALSVAYGESTGTLSKGLYDILSSSISASKATGVLEAAVIAAKAGMTTTAISADVLTSVLNAYNLEADRAVYVTDVLFATVKRGKTTFPELANSLGMVVTNAALVGVSLEELTAAIATMTRAGVKTRWAVTAMNAIMMGFLKPTSEAVDLAKELGFELSAAGVQAEGFTAIMQRMAGLGPGGIAEIFPNVRALRGLSPLLANIAGYMTDVERTTKSAGAAAEAFRKSTSTLAHRLDQFKEWWNKQMTGVGMPLTPLVGGVLDVIQGEYGFRSPTELAKDAAKQPMVKQIADALFISGMLVSGGVAKRVIVNLRGLGITGGGPRGDERGYLPATAERMAELGDKGAQAAERSRQAGRDREALGAAKAARVAERARQGELLRIYMGTVTEREAAIGGIRAGQEANLQALFGAAEIGRLRAAGKPKAADLRAVVLAYRAEIGRIREDEKAAELAGGEGYGKWQFDVQRDWAKQVREAHLAIIERRYREREEKEQAREEKRRAREEEAAQKKRNAIIAAAYSVGGEAFRPRVARGIERWGGAGKDDPNKPLRSIDKTLKRIERKFKQPLGMGQ